MQFFKTIMVVCPDMFGYALSSDVFRSTYEHCVCRSAVGMLRKYHHSKAGTISKLKVHPQSSQIKNFPLQN